MRTEMSISVDAFPSQRNLVLRLRSFTKVVGCLHGGVSDSAPERTVANAVSKMFLVGDVRGRDAVIVDDMADTCGTMLEAASVLKEHGARRVIAAIVHPIFSGSALQRLDASPIDTVIFTNTVPVDMTTFSQHCSDTLRLVCVDVSPIFAAAITRIHNGDSISSLFQYQGKSNGATKDAVMF